MSRFNLLSTLGVVLLFFSQNAAFATSASDRGINIQSFVKRPDGTPVNLASATVNVKIYSQNDCILLDEDHPATAITNGFVYVVLGRGTSSTHDYGLSLAEALDNSTPRTGLDKITGGTANCNYTPSSSDSRKLRLSFVDSGNANTVVTADFNLRSSGFSVHSEETQKIQGKSASDLLQVNGTVTQAKINQLVDHILAPIAAASANQAFMWNGTDLVAYDPANGAYLTANTVPGNSVISLPYSKITSVPAPLTTISGLSCTNGQVLKSNGTAWECGSDATGSGAVASVAGKTGVVSLVASDISDFGTTVATQISDMKGANNGLASLNGSGKVPSTQLALGASDIPSLDAGKITTGTLTVPVSSSSVSASTGQFTSLKIYDGSANYLTQSAPSGGFSGSGYTVRWPSSVGSANQILSISSVTSGVADLSWSTPSASGITSLNGDPTGTQTFAVGSSGTAPAFVTASGTHTLNLPLAAGAGVTAGLISKTQFDKFDTKMETITDAPLADGKVWVGDSGNKPAAVSLSGDLTIANTGAATVGGLKGKTISSAPTLDGQVFRYNGTQFAPSFVAMTDLRSSVTGTNAFPTACTSSQTLTYNSVGDVMSCQNISVSASNFSSQSAATFLAAPTGSAGSPSFRTIAATDLPSGVVTDGTYKSVTVDTYGRVTAGTNPTTISEYGITNAVVNGTQTGAVSLGSSSANSLTFKTNNAAQMTITSEGNVGIGLTSPWDFVSMYKANSSPKVQLIAENTSTNTARYPQFQVINYAGSPSTGSAGSPNFSLVNLRGTSSTSAAIRANEPLGSFSFNAGYDTSSSYREGASLWATAEENHSSTAGGTNFAFYTISLGSTASTEKMRISANGLVGIGTADPTMKLDVNGGIRVGTDATVCDSTISGSIRYSSGTIQLCDGTSWKTLSVSSNAWVTKTSAYTAVAGDRIFADTSSGAFTITLPSSPSVGDTIRISDVSGSFATNNLTLDPTASIKIMSQSV